MTEIELLVDLHQNNDRQGPGSEVETMKALSFMQLPAYPLSVADIGCGSGSHTLALAKNINAHITAVDLYPAFLNKLAERAEQENLTDKVDTISASMEELPFDDNSLDIIWSEGAIYNMGFKKGIQEWRKFLKPGGYVAVSEITWITLKRPKEIEEFWCEEYPEIDTAGNKIKILEENGYSLEGYFYLSQKSWIDHYYKPLASSFSDYLNKHNHSKMAQEIVQLHAEEIELYDRFKDYYSYGFYIAKKI